jgi:hypothetical protein
MKCMEGKMRIKLRMLAANMRLWDKAGNCEDTVADTSDRNGE